MRWSGVLGLFLLAASSLACQVYAGQTLNSQSAEDIAAKKQWAHLLHFRKHPYTFRFIGQNDSDDFYLSEEGKTSLLAELKADVSAFKKTDMPDNESAQCRFPARYHWLKQQFPEETFIDQTCSEFNEWKSEINAHYLTLIFPASHINSPSSMYGHTLVRLDREDESKSKLLSYSVNFAANADPSDNELVFSFKGLTGGYPGVVSVMPYYEKTNEYQHMEYRDIWEYRLNLTEEEVDQFVRHVWETKDTYFDYYFFDENCSYRLLALLDASSERSDLTKNFAFTAVPVDTIRVLQDADLVETTHYRASAASGLEYKSQQTRDSVLKAARDLVDTEADIEQLLIGLNEQEQVRALELAHAYARYLAIKKQKDNPKLRKRTIKLLSARAKRPVDAGYAEPPTPAIRDDEGHLSSRFAVWAGGASGDQGDAEFVDLRLRLAYHNVMDLPDGYVPGSQIQMGQFDARVWDDSEVRLNRFILIDVLSLSHQTYFQSPIAWAVTTGLERPLGDQGDLYGYLKVAFGQAYLTDIGRFYGLAEVQLLADDQFEKGYQLSIGPRVGWLLQQSQYQAQIEANFQEFSLGDTVKRRSLTAELGYTLAPNWQFRLAAKGTQSEKDNIQVDQSEISTGINWYY